MSIDVSDEPNGVGVYARIEASIAELRRDSADRLDRIEDKLDTRMTTQDSKVDAIKSDLDQLRGELRGSLGVVKWLGPTGVAALLYGVAKSQGLL